MKLSISDLAPELPLDGSATIRWVAEPGQTVPRGEPLLVAEISGTDHVFSAREPVALRFVYRASQDTVSFDEDIVQIAENDIVFDDYLSNEAVEDLDLDLDESTKAKLTIMQGRIDAILSGEVAIPEGRVPKPDDRRLFAPFSAGDKGRAGSLARAWMLMAEQKAEQSGEIAGIDAAIDHMYDSLGRYPTGMVEHAILLFMTDHKPARNRLFIRPLSERQPGLLPSFG